MHPHTFEILSEMSAGNSITRRISNECRTGLHTPLWCAKCAEHGTAYVGRLPEYNSLSANTGGLVPRAPGCEPPGTSRTEVGELRMVFLNRWASTFCKAIAFPLVATLAIGMPTAAHAARIDFACVFMTDSSREVFQLVLDERSLSAIVIPEGQKDFAIDTASFSPNAVIFKHGKNTWYLSRLSLEILRMPTNSEDESLIERGTCQRIVRQF